MVEPAKQLYVFDDFCLDTTECQLKRQGEVIPLPPKVFDVLRVMVENRGRILDKDFLHRTLWPDTFVEDGTLAQYVFLLRKALNEESAGHRFIETVPRRGYRFVATVQEITEAADGQGKTVNGSYGLLSPTASNGFQQALAIPPESLPSPQAPSPFTNWQSFLRSKTVIAVVTLFLLVGIAFAYYLLRRFPSIVPSSHTMQITKLTTIGKAAFPALSPDSKYVAFVLDDAGKQSVWVRQLAAANNVQVIAPAEVDYLGLTFSPDGNYLYYLVYTRPVIFGTLYRMPVLGGAATKLIEDIDSPVAFSPDGKQLAFVRIDPLKSESYILVADTDGREQKTVATRKRPEYFSANDGVAWSPDGNVLACAAGSTNASGPFMNLVGINASDGKEISLSTHPWKQVGQITWRKDGHGLIAVARSQDSPLSTTQLWHFPYPTGSPSRITNDLNLYSKLSPNSDLSKLVTIQSSRVSSLWVVPEADASRAVQIGGASMDNYAHKLGLAWLRNNELIFGSYASGNADLWLMNSDGSNARQLTVDPNIDLAPTVSSSETPFVAFVSNRGGGYSIWRMDAEGQNISRVTKGQTDYYPSISPDGKWIFYTNIISDLPTVWKVPATGGEPVQFLSDSAFNPVVSPDGKSVALFYAMPKDLVFKLALVPIDGGTPSKIFDLIAQDFSVVRWSNDGQWITYVDTKNGVSNIWAQPIDGSPAKQLTNFKSDLIFRFAWSPDGKTLACERGFFVNDVVVVSDFLPT